MEEQVIINRVANSGLITIDLEEYYPTHSYISFDIKPYLFMELILKEKDFREQLKNTDWSAYQNKVVCIECTADAIIPVWAYMLIAAYLAPIATEVHTGSIDMVIERSLLLSIAAIDATKFKEQRVVVKGCGDKQISPAVYAAITAKLQPVAKSIMYGEPCSTVPVYKAK
jgi:hypothetical protein